MATDLTQLLANPEISGLDRQRKMAQLLVQQGMQTPQSQMVGNVYVGASPWQFLGNLAQQYVGEQELKDIDKKELELAKALRQKEAADLSKFAALQYGGQQIPAQAQAGPMPDGGNIPIGTTLSEPDPMAAFQLASESTSPLLRSQLAEMLKGQKFAEGEVMQRYNPATGKMETTGQGNAKYRAPIQIDTGTAIELRDPLDPTKVISRIGKSQMPSAPQIIETANGFVAVNPRNPTEATPVTIGGQPLMGNKANLPEGATKQVTGATNLKDAITNYKETLKGFSTLDMANPNARASMGNAYNNMMLQAKEAYNLGVLNGPDYEILQSVVKDPTNPTSLLVGKKTLEKQADDLSKQADLIIGNVYKTHNRPVPENLKAKGVSDKQEQQFDPKLLQYMTPEQRKLFGG